MPDSSTSTIFALNKYPKMRPLQHSTIKLGLIMHFTPDTSSLPGVFRNVREKENGDGRTRLPNPQPSLNPQVVSLIDPLHPLLYKISSIDR